jgi:hypothetical protein
MGPDNEMIWDSETMSANKTRGVRTRNPSKRFSSKLAVFGGPGGSSDDDNAAPEAVVTVPQARCRRKHRPGCGRCENVPCGLTDFHSSIALQSSGPRLTIVPTRASRLA